MRNSQTKKFYYSPWQGFQVVVQTFIYEGVASDEELSEIEGEIKQVEELLSATIYHSPNA